MISFKQFLIEKEVIDHDAILHGSHMVGKYHTRNSINPTITARREKKEYIEKLKRHGVVQDEYGGISHPDPSAQRALQTGISQGVDVEYAAQPKVRTDPTHPRYIKPSSRELRTKKGERVGLGAYLKATRSFEMRNKK